MRVAVFGGSFNPVHLDHVEMACYIRDQLNIDRFLVVPNATPPHKSTCSISFADRVNMLKDAFSGLSGFEISTIEKDPHTKHYTFDTLTKLKELYKDDMLFFCMGMDSLIYLDKWYKGLELIKLSNLVVTQREGYLYTQINEPVKKFLSENALLDTDRNFEPHLNNTDKNNCIILSRCFHSVSSSKIREEIEAFYKTGSDKDNCALFFDNIDSYPLCKNFLSRNTIEYIFRHSLYKQ